MKALPMARSCFFPMLVMLVLGLFTGCDSDNTSEALWPELEPGTPRDEALRGDVETLVRTLEDVHPAPYAITPKAAFYAAAQALAEDIPTLQDYEVDVRFAQLTALLGDSHTTIYPWSAWSLPPILPLRFYAFEDGLFVISATTDYQDLLRARITHIGEQPVDDALAQVATLISYENEAWRRALVPRYVVHGRMLHTLGLAETPNAVTLSFETETGASVTRTLPTLTDQSGTIWLSGLEGPVPLQFQSTRGHYWTTYLPEDQTVYFQYNRCLIEPGRPFQDTVDDLVTLLQTHPVDQVVVDLRHNTGGDSRIIQPLYDLFDSYPPEAQASGRLVVLIGEHTFSSGLMNALELHERWNGLLVGTPTGGKPNHYGEVRGFNLAQSRLRVNHSTKYFTLLPNADPASLNPDIQVPLRAADFFAGRDAALEAVTSSGPSTP
ncbi:MAG: hypothetical protein AAGI71_09455 [Bacteroidota bacterium]